MATTLAYPLGDVTLLVFVVGLLALNAWKPSRSWTLIAAGLATMAVADGIFLWQSSNGTYVEGQALDALWPAAALLLGHAAWQPSAREATRLEGWRLLAMPALFALMPVGLLVYGNLQPMNTPALVLAAAALVVAVVRMAYTFSNTLRLTAEATAAALTDALTGLGNRRALLADLEAELADDPATTRRCSCCSISTASRTTTTPSGTRPATRCWCGSAAPRGGGRRRGSRLQARRRRVLRPAPARPEPRQRRRGPRRRRRCTSAARASTSRLPRHRDPAGGGARLGRARSSIADQRMYAQKGCGAGRRRPPDARRPAPDGLGADARAARAHRRRGPARPGRRPAPRAACP